MVVATSPAAAQDALGADRDRVLRPGGSRRCAEALEQGAPQLHDSVPGNLAFDYDYGDEAAAAAAIGSAAHVTRLTVDSTRVSGNPMEPKACVVVYDPRRMRTTSTRARRACH